jgi:hypothetical protein
MTLDSIKINDKGSYGLWSPVWVNEITDTHAVMRDQRGETLKVYRDLFEKYFKKDK